MHGVAEPRHIKSQVIIYLDQARRTGQIGLSTAARRRIALFQFAATFGNRPAANLSKADIERWQESTTHLAASTRRLYWSILHLFVKWLVEKGHLRRDVMLGMKPPRVPKAIHRALSEDDAAALLAACIDSRERLIVTLGLQLGIRRAEIAALEVGDVDVTARVIDVNGKGGDQRRLPLTEAAVRVATAYLSEQGLRAGPLIRSRTVPSAGVKPDTVGRLVTVICWRAGIKSRPWDGVGTHSMRHTMASDAYLRTRDVLAVADLLGHASLNNTQRYVRGLDIERLREAAEGRRYGG